MRPPEPSVVAVIVGTVASQDEEHQIDVAVAVAVILAEIHVGVGLVKGTNDDLRRRAASVILTVVNGVRAYHVELRLELTVGIITEVVTHTAGAGHELPVRLSVAGIVLLIHHVIDVVMEVIARELLILILHQHYQALEVVIVVLSSTAGSQSLLLALLHLTLGIPHLLCHLRSLILLKVFHIRQLCALTHSCVMSHLGRRLQQTILQLGIDIIATLVFYHRVTILGRREVQPLVTHQSQRQLCAVGLRHLHGAWVGGYGHHADCTQQQGR